MMTCNVSTESRWQALGHPPATHYSSTHGKLRLAGLHLKAACHTGMGRPVVAALLQHLSSSVLHRSFALRDNIHVLMEESGMQCIHS